MAPLNLRILTLNCWDLPIPWPFGSPDRKTRIRAIADELSRGSWDIVALEEVWSLSDYELIRGAVSKVLPNAVYFHSGFIGSGLCLFTKGQIASTFLHPYTLNGYAHHIHHGDWYGGKAVAMARVIMHGEWRISVYITHLHASYTEKHDPSCAHRLVQAYELAQFVRETSTGQSDLTLVLGDTNLDPDEPATKLLMDIAGLRDAFLDCTAALGSSNSSRTGFTCGSPSNTYATAKPSPKRYDYILYKTATDVNGRVERCETTMDRIPREPPISYSDHEAVCAEISLWKEAYSPIVVERTPPVNPRLIEDSLVVINEAIDSAKSARRTCGYVAGASIVVFMLTFVLHAFVPYLVIPIMIVRLILTLLLTFCFCNGVIALKMEINSLKGTKTSMGLCLLNPSIRPSSESSSSSYGSLEAYDETVGLLDGRQHRAKVEEVL